MWKFVVAVACHDNVEMLRRWVSRAGTLHVNKEDTLFVMVDTCSANPEFLKEFDCLQKEPPLTYIRFMRTEQGNYATGAYWHVYNSLEAENYIFLQDSIYLRHDDFIPRMQLFLKHNDVVYFYYFDYKQHICMPEYVEKQVGVRPGFGIFGPMFGVPKHVLDRIPKEWMCLPTTKKEEEGWERRWSAIFHAVGAKFLCLSGLLGDIWTYHPYIIKEFPHRS